MVSVVGQLSSSVRSLFLNFPIVARICVSIKIIIKQPYNMQISEMNWFHVHNKEHWCYAMHRKFPWKMNIIRSLCFQQNNSIFGCNSMMTAAYMFASKTDNRMNFPGRSVESAERQRKTIEWIRLHQNMRYYQ